MNIGPGDEEASEGGLGAFGLGRKRERRWFVPGIRIPPSRRSRREG